MKVHGVSPFSRHCLTTRSIYAASIFRACATSAWPPSSSSLASVGTSFKTWAYEHGYELLIAKDVTTSSDAEGHEMSMKHIMPRLARVVQSGDITLTRT